MKFIKSFLPAALFSLTLAACDGGESPTVNLNVNVNEDAPAEETRPVSNPRFDIYANVRLNSDLSHLSDNQKKMLSLLIDAAKLTDDIFWLQVWGDREPLLNGIEDPKARQFAEYNYGPWDRLADDQSFLESYGPRPPGARFYPENMSREEFDAWEQEGKDGLYTLVQRDAEGCLLYTSDAADE